MSIDYTTDLGDVTAMENDSIDALEARVESLIRLCADLHRKNHELTLEGQNLRSKLAKLSSKQEQARDRLNQIGERIKALETSA